MIAIAIVLLLAGFLLFLPLRSAFAATAVLYPNGPGDSPVGMGIPDNDDGEDATDPFSGVPVAGPARWANVDDDPTHDGDTSYVETDGDDNGDLYTLDNPAFATGTVINSIELCAVMRRASSTQRGGFFGLKSGTTESWGSLISWPGGSDTAYAQYCRTYATDPFTGSGWTKAAIDALQVGFFSNDGTQSGLRATQITVTVDYGAVSSASSAVSSMISSVPVSSAASSVAVSSASASSIGLCSATDLVGYWKLDEGTGSTAIDMAGGDNTGTHENGPVYVTGTTLLSANPFAVSYDGVDDQTRIAGSGDVAFGMSGFTVTAFIKPDGGNRSVLGNYGPVTGGNRGWGLYVYASNHLNFFGYGDEGLSDTAHAAVIHDGDWHHVAGVYERSGSGLTIKVYVDGDLKGSHTATVGNLASPHDLLLGAYQGQPRYNGGLDDVRVYGRELSAGEILALANGCTGSSASSVAPISSITSASAVPASSSSSSVPSGPLCNGLAATIFVQDGVIVGGPDDGDVYDGELRGTWGNDVLVGTTDADEMSGRSGDDVMCGLGGDDDMDGGFGDDWMDGGSGEDVMDGGMGMDTLYGREDDDELAGGIGEDQMFGGAGNDRMDGDMGEDVACGGDGDDILEGSMGDDRMDGGSGTDALDGGSFGSDQCVNAASAVRCEVLTGTVPECAGM